MLPQLTVWPLAVSTGELCCHHQVLCTNPRYRQYSALGDDPQFRLKRRLPAGWYMLEVLMNLPVRACTGILHFDTGDGITEEQRYRLPIRSGRMAKRLVHLPAAAQVRFDPFRAQGDFELQHFRLVRMSRRAALRRIRTKLASQRGDLSPAIVEESEASLWQSYDRLFDTLSAKDAICYAAWINSQEQPAIPESAEQHVMIAGWRWLPTFSVIVPTYDTDPGHLRSCLDSVLAQSYPHWALCVADDASTQPHVREILDEYQARDPRVRVEYREHNGHIAQASNSALALASGEFVAFLDHDDILAPHALFEVARALQLRPSAQFLYSDEDKLDAAGHRCDPFFKPDYSPDLLYSQNYCCHLGVYRRELVDLAGGFRVGFEGSQDYDLLLRCLEHVDDPADVVHIPRVLYHWRQSTGSTAAGHDRKDYAAEAARHAVEEHLSKRQSGVQVEVIEPGLYRHRWPLPAERPLVSLIVPTRDGHDVLSKCIGSIQSRTRYAPYEILVVDNQSTCPETLAYLAALAEQDDVRILRYDQPFNFSAINNLAAREAYGTVLALVNNDVEVISPGWLEEMVSHALRPDVACVGAKLFYPDGTLQHGGVVLGIGGIAGHSYRYLPGDASGYFSRLKVVHNVSAVTGAALVVRKAVFEEVGGLDEERLQVAFNDVDFCLKCRKAGYRNVWTPFAELYHHESKTRGVDRTPEQVARFQMEIQAMARRWCDLLRHDPYYNPNLTLSREDYSLAAVSRAPVSRTT